MRTLPPGKYYIGDPCYIFNDGTWDRLLEETDFFKQNTFNGRTIFVHQTAYGDGEYKGSNGHEFGVDAGVIGAIPVELIEDLDGAKAGVVVDAPDGLRCYWSDGDFEFQYGVQRLSILTNDFAPPELDYNEGDDDDDIRAQDWFGIR